MNKQNKEQAERFHIRRKFCQKLIKFNDFFIEPIKIFFKKCAKKSKTLLEKREGFKHMS